MPMGPDQVMLTLMGRYEPPLGAVGRGLDRLVLHRIAHPGRAHLCGGWDYWLERWPGSRRGLRGYGRRPGTNDITAQVETTQWIYDVPLQLTTRKPSTTPSLTHSLGARQSERRLASSSARGCRSSTVSATTAVVDVDLTWHVTPALLVVFAVVSVSPARRWHSG
jgi:hypothetical protein